MVKLISFPQKYVDSKGQFKMQIKKYKYYALTDHNFRTNKKLKLFIDAIKNKNILIKQNSTMT